MKLLELLARKGTIEILKVLDTEPKRFGQLVSALRPVVIRRTIARRLKELEIAGLIIRQVTHERPPSVTYGLTEKGKRKIKLIGELER